MGSVYLAALFVGRPRSVLPALGLAAAVMVAVDPNVLWSVSFQLSFAAMAGIALLAEPLDRRIRSLYEHGVLSRIDLPPVVSQAVTAGSYVLAMTVAATLATLPLVAFYFQRVSLVGLPTTLLVLPALPFILVTQAVAGLVGLLSTGLAQPLGWLAWLATAYLTGVVGLVARLPGASIDTGQVAPFLVWAYYGLLAALYVRPPLLRSLYRWRTPFENMPRSLPLGDRGVPWWVVAPVASLAALLWIAALSQPDDRLRVAFVDVGQGDAAFIEGPRGQQVVVDGGPDPVEFVQFLGERMPFRDRTIELIVLTHDHADHVDGLIEVLRRYDVERVLEREFEFDGAPYQAWRRAVDKEGAQVIQAQPGLVVALDGGAFIQVVGPPQKLLRGTPSDIDNASVVVRLVYGAVSFLLAGDIFSEAEAVLVREGAPIDSDVLKVGHHGSRNSSSAAFLERVTPAAAVVSAGENNLFGHPHAETEEALRRRVPGEQLFVTRDSGTIEFTTDGKRLEVKTTR